MSFQFPDIYNHSVYENVTIKRSGQQCYICFLIYKINLCRRMLQSRDQVSNAIFVSCYIKSICVGECYNQEIRSAMLYLYPDI